MERVVLTMLEYLSKQLDITTVEVNSDIEYDYNSFSLSGVKIESDRYIYPAALGFDLGCGVGVFKLQNCNREKLNRISKTTKSAFGICNKEKVVSKLQSKQYCILLQNIIGETCLGDIESGNHFIEIQANSKQEYFIVIHSGISESMKELFQYFFIDLYQKYAIRNENETNGYVIKIPYNDEIGKEFYDVCLVADEWARYNRKYIASKIGIKLGCEVQYCFDTSHEFLAKSNNGVIHSNGVQKLVTINKRNFGIIISGEGHNNYLIEGINGNFYINHGTKLKGENREKKRVYGEVDELLCNNDLNEKIKVIDILKPILNCKKIGEKYEYTFF